MDKLETFCRAIDSTNRWTGRVAAWAVVPLTLFVVIDVILRYVFNKPTIWAWDINIQLLGFIAIMGAGYALLYGSHVAVDVLVVRLSRRKKAILDLATSTFFFLGIGVMLWQQIEQAAASVEMKEKYLSVFLPPIYPLQVAIALGVLLLLLQGLVKFIRDLSIVIKPRGIEQP